MSNFFRRGVSKICFVPTIAVKTAPTTIEITAGTDLSPAINDIAGFMLNNSPIPVPNLAEVFTSQIDGEDTTDDSTLTFNDDNSLTTIRTALTKGTAGYIVLMPYGKVTAKRCEVWPVKVTGFNDVYSTGNDPATAVAGFAITATPTQNAVLPTFP